MRGEKERRGEGGDEEEERKSKLGGERISGRAKEGKKAKRTGENRRMKDRGKKKNGRRDRFVRGGNKKKWPFVLSTVDGKMKSEGEIEGEKEI